MILRHLSRRTAAKALRPNAKSVKSAEKHAIAANPKATQNAATVPDYNTAALEVVREQVHALTKNVSRRINKHFELYDKYNLFNQAEAEQDFADTMSELNQLSISFSIERTTWIHDVQKKFEEHTKNNKQRTSEHDDKEKIRFATNLNEYMWKDYLDKTIGQNHPVLMNLSMSIIKSLMNKRAKQAYKFSFFTLEGINNLLIHTNNEPLSQLESGIIVNKVAASLNILNLLKKFLAVLIVGIVLTACYEFLEAKEKMEESKNKAPKLALDERKLIAKIAYIESKENKTDRDYEKLSFLQEELALLKKEHEANTATFEKYKAILENKFNPVWIASRVMERPLETSRKIFGLFVDENNQQDAKNLLENTATHQESNNVNSANPF